MSTLSLTLRKTCIFSFSPSFIILLIHGILTESPFPATGLIPLFFSALYSDICRRQASANARRTTGLSKSQSAIGHPLVDLIFAAAILPFLIVSWVYDMGDKWERWWSQPSLIVLGTYGSVGLLYNCMVHIFFVLKYVFEVVAGMQTHKACPHCTHCAHERERERAGPVGVAGYEGVPQDEEGRVSLDETVVDGGKDVV